MQLWGDALRPWMWKEAFWVGKQIGWASVPDVWVRALGAEQSRWRTDVASRWVHLALVLGN
jgi:hypothetical protein